MNDSILKRTIPSSNEKITAVGLGTWQTFDVGKVTKSELLLCVLCVLTLRTLRETALDFEKLTS